MDGRVPEPKGPAMSDEETTIEEMRDRWVSAAQCHIASIERYGALCMSILAAIADGRSQRYILELVGDSMNACDHVDDESEALWNRAAKETGEMSAGEAAVYEQQAYA